MFVESWHRMHCASSCLAPPMCAMLEVVRPFAQWDTGVPSLKSIDWESFIQSMEAVDRMQKLERKMKAIEEDDEDMNDLMSFE